eukprot:97858-Chlamydomonas_euryale.AAC.4
MPSQCLGAEQPVHAQPATSCRAACACPASAAPARRSSGALRGRGDARRDPAAKPRTQRWPLLAATLLAPPGCDPVGPSWLRPCWPLLVQELLAFLPLSACWCQRCPSLSWIALLDLAGPSLPKSCTAGLYCWSVLLDCTAGTLLAPPCPSTVNPFLLDPCWLPSSPQRRSCSADVRASCRPSGGHAVPSSLRRLNTRTATCATSQQPGDRPHKRDSSSTLSHMASSASSPATGLCRGSAAIAATSTMQ